MPLSLHDPDGDGRRGWPYWVGMLVLTASYIGSAKLGLMMDAVSGFATLVWPPSGIALAALMLFGIDMWPGVLLGAFVANTWNGATSPVAMGIAVGNTLEAVVGALALRSVAIPFRLDRVRHVAALIGWGALLSTVVSATFGVTTLLLGGVVTYARFVETWRAWWLGDALGDLVVAPLLLAIGSAGVALPRKRLPEAAALALSTIVMALLVFFNAPSLPTHPLRMPFMLFPSLAWGALRFGIGGATLTTFLLSVIAISGTALGHGPYVRETLAGGLISLQAYTAVVASTMLFFGAAITERRNAIRAREEVLAIVSHDLKTPLSSIRMSADRLLKLLPPGDEGSKARGSVEVVERSALRMQHLIRDLLDLATLDTGHLSLTFEDVDVNALVTEAAEMMRSIAEAKRQSIQTSIREDGLKMRCDRERVLQVLSNLVGNATKFTDEGGSIGIRVERQGRLFIQLSVEDTGIGIPQNQLRHVFDRYWKARPTTREGSGLGLSIAREIVAAHGGRMWARSAPGKGSTFCFTLPLSNAAERDR